MKEGKGEKKKPKGIYASTNNLLLSLIKLSTLGHSGLPLTVQFSLHTREPLANTAAGMDMMFIHA